MRLILLSVLLFTTEIGYSQPSNPLEYAKWAKPIFIAAREKLPSSCPITKDWISKMIEVFDFSIANYRGENFFYGPKLDQLNNEVLELLKKAQSENSSCQHILDEFLKKGQPQTFEQASNYQSGNSTSPYFKEENNGETQSDYFNNKYIEEDSPLYIKTEFNFPDDLFGENQKLANTIKYRIARFNSPDYDWKNFELDILNLFKDFLDALSKEFKNVRRNFDLSELPDLYQLAIGANMIDTKEVFEALKELDDEKIQQVCTEYVQNAETLGVKNAFMRLKERLAKP